MLAVGSAPRARVQNRAMELARAIASRLVEVERRIHAAVSSAGRSPDDVRLVAVSKTFGLDHVNAAIDAGLGDLGENKVQEALTKSAATAGRPVAWHFIGHLQSNKARKAAGAFDWIHSVDSLALLERLDRAAGDAGRRPRVLVQVDLAGEVTKHGAPEEAAPVIVAAAERCEHLELRGLMTMPPWSSDPEAARPYFNRLATMRRELLPTLRAPERFDQLSMGMSHDLEVAIDEGATMVRVGTALFGKRRPALQNRSVPAEK